MGKSSEKRPFIAFYFDGFEEACDAARRAGIDEDHVVTGLFRLWRHCWRKKTIHVRSEELPRFFKGYNDKLRSALAADFLQLNIEVPDEGYMDLVRGAEQYLRIREARSRGGHASKGNLNRGKSPGSSREPAGEQPEEPPGSAPALTASSDQRAASSDQTPPIPPSHARGAEPEERDCRCTRRPCRHELGLAVVPEPPPTPPTPAEQAFGQLLERVRGRGAAYAAVQLQPLRPELVDGKLVLHAKDGFQGDWLAEHYLPMLREEAAAGAGPPIELRYPPKSAGATA